MFQIGAGSPETSPNPMLTRASWRKMLGKGRGRWGKLLVGSYYKQLHGTFLDILSFHVVDVLHKDLAPQRQRVTVAVKTQSA